MQANVEEPFDRVVVNELLNVYAMIMTNESMVIGCFISVGGLEKDDLRYIASLRHTPAVPLAIDDMINIVIENITTNRGSSPTDMKLPSTIVFNGETLENAKGIWTGSNVPDDVRVELTCVGLEPLTSEDSEETSELGGVLAQCTSSVDLV